MDLFETMKDIVRADCEQRGWPTPDGKPASQEAHAIIHGANEALRAYDGKTSLLEWVIDNIETKPSAELVESALKMANTEAARVAFSGNGSAQIREFGNENS